jgi:hypothetical protein
MIDDGLSIDSGITSFLIECLMWNTPDSILNEGTTWEARIFQSLLFLINNTKNEEQCKSWREVSEMLYLFHNRRKWDAGKAYFFLRQTAEYLDL